MSSSSLKAVCATSCPWGAADENETYSLAANFQQELFEGFELQVSALYSTSETSFEGEVEEINLPLTLNNPYLSGFSDFGFGFGGLGPVLSGR